ncbi:acetate kinase, partial [Xanthomonas citri pv. citri]
MDDPTIETIDKLTMLAPLHQSQSLRLIRAIRHLRPDLVQAASFDTAFHRTNAEVVRRFAIPRRLHDDGIKRYGFHGPSYNLSPVNSYAAPNLVQSKAVVAHLDSATGLCALEAGVNHDASIG